VVGAVLVSDEDQVMLISDGGTLVRTRVAEISVLGRNTQGVRLIKLSNGEKLVGIERVAETDDDEESSEEGGEGSLAGGDASSAESPISED
jgi:DNA gyrase subunit A